MNYKFLVKPITHLFFWVLYFFIVFILKPYYGKEPTSWYDRIDIKLLIIVLPLTYANEFFLLPYFFKKKRYLNYLTYSFIIIALLFIVTTFYCYYIINCYCEYTICLGSNLWKFLLPLIFLSLIWFLFLLFEKQKQLELSDKERLEIELKFLKSQINPHVLFNNMNTVYAQAVKGSDNVAEMILMLSENLKYILYQSEVKTIALEEEIGFIDNYLEFQKLRTEGINRVIFNKNITSYNYKIAPLLLISLIENAFKHSTYKEDALSDIVIELNVNDGILKFYCSNEFAMDGTTRHTEGFQIGLKNLKKRLHLLYPNTHSFTILKIENTFIAQLEIILQ